jgi:2-polyprenyl-3-methyl-5-hydroxy-6-metoxy-1,4-benzoquinol methylase
MVDRVLEPEVMDTPEEARVYDAMDHAEVNARFVADFLAAHGPCRGGPILDVGTGTARIPIVLCEADPKARVVAVDLARHMLDLAAANVRARGLEGRITLRLADAKVGPAETFEAVISNTIVHHIPEPARVLAAMVGAVAPGGTLFVRDLARPATESHLGMLVERYAGNETDHARALFAASLAAALTVAEVEALAHPLGIPAGAVRMTSDRHWTLTWTRP